MQACNLCIGLDWGSIYIVLSWSSEKFLVLPGLVTDLPLLLHCRCFVYLTKRELPGVSQITPSSTVHRQLIPACLGYAKGYLCNCLSDSIVNLTINVLVSHFREVPEPRLERHTPHHTTSLTMKATILEKVSQVRRIQRAKQLAEKHKLSQKVMQRQNRTRERHSRRAKHQGSFVYQPCQRQYNY